MLQQRERKGLDLADNHMFHELLKSTFSRWTFCQTTQTTVTAFTGIQAFALVLVQLWKGKHKTLSCPPPQKKTEYALLNHSEHDSRTQQKCGPLVPAQSQYPTT